MSEQPKTSAGYSAGTSALLLITSTSKIANVQQCPILMPHRCISLSPPNSWCNKAYISTFFKRICGHSFFKYTSGSFQGTRRIYSIVPAYFISRLVSIRAVSPRSLSHRSGPLCDRHYTKYTVIVFSPKGLQLKGHINLCHLLHSQSQNELKCTEWCNKVSGIP